MTVSKSQKVEKSHIRRCNVFGSHDMLAVRNKKNKRLKVFVLVAVYVPEEPDVYENKDMLCSGHCVCVWTFFFFFFFSLNSNSGKVKVQNAKLVRSIDCI